MKYKNSIKSIAIGSFDGIHIAHQALIEKAEAVVIIERNGGYLTPGYKRSLYTQKPCFFYHFDKIRHLSPEAFVEQLQQDFPLLEKIVVGYDFVFGKGKSGDVRHLRKCFGGEVEVVGEITLDGISVHSRTIRQYLKEGNVRMGKRLLGRSYRIDGSVIRGQGIGREKLVPTINLKVIQYQLPKEGVYATRTYVGGVWRESVSFLGHRVTTDGSFAVETHVIGEEISVKEYEPVWIMFESMIRKNQKFDSIETLKVQIDEDIAICRNLLENAFK